MNKGTWLAVGIFAVLLVVVLATRDRGGNVNVGVPKLELPRVEKEKVTSIEVTGAVAATLKREGQAWSVVDPAAAGKAHPADEAQVMSLLDGLKELKATDFVTQKAERHAELELDSAKGLAVKVKGASGVLVDVVFGKAAKSGGVYLRAAGKDSVFVTPSSLPWMARRDAKGWRKRAFFPAKFEELTQLTVHSEDGATLPLQAGADGQWALTPGTSTPEGYRFDPEAARAIGLTLASASAQEFADGLSDEVLGFSGPHPRVVAQAKDGKSYTLHLGQPPLADSDAGTIAPAGAIAARLEGDTQAYWIPSHQAEALKKRVGDLRATNLMNFEVEKVKRLVVQAAGKKTVVAREGGAWNVLEPKALPAGFEFDPAQVTSQLHSLNSLRAARVVDGVAEDKAGLNKPAVTVEVALEEGPALTLKLGGEAPPAGNAGPVVYAKGTLDGLVYAVPTAQRTRLEGGLELFKKPPPPPDFGQQLRGLEGLPPEIRQQLEAQLRQRQQ